ncbi:MAG TPA: Gfo/Idh/MocA family oxidoreductase [Candidatus Brocadiia bacterium]|nr:Gfo/Idh/MocA family oxidoreductase [Candidatus Brocadiia bacterium]
MKKLALLQVGLGGMGSWWWQILSEHPNFEVIGAVELNDEIYQQFHSMGFPIFKNFLDGLEKVHCDAVLICTPNDTHRPYAIAAMRAGRHVIMEKPLATNMADARSILKTSQSSKRICMICQNYRFGPVAMAVKQALDAGVIGRVEYGEFSFHKSVRFGGWHEQLEEPLLEDMAVHQFDMLRYFLGSNASRVMAKSWKPSWSWYSGNAAAVAAIDFESGCSIAYSGSWVSRGAETSWNGRLRLVGEKGEIYIPDDDRPFYVLAETPDQPVPIEIVPYYPTGHHGLLYAFYKALQDGIRPPTDVEDNINTFAIGMNAILSAKSNRWVSVKG